MEKRQLQTTLQKLEAKWDSGRVSTPDEIVKLNKQVRELKRRIQDFG